MGSSGSLIAHQLNKKSMIAQSFQYESPGSLAEAIALLNQQNRGAEAEALRLQAGTMVKLDD